jgi:hypothetical protein
MFGAAVAAFLYEYGTLKPANFEGAKDMDTALFQAGKKKEIKKKTSKKPPLISPPEDESLATVEDLPSPKKKSKMGGKKASKEIPPMEQDVENPILTIANSPVAEEAPKKVLKKKKNKAVVDTETYIDVSTTDTDML